jgi:hypothetical protein
MADNDDLDTRIAHAVARALATFVPSGPAATVTAGGAAGVGTSPVPTGPTLPPGARLAVMAEKQAQFGIVYLMVGYYPNAEDALRDCRILEARDGAICHLVAFLPRSGGVVSIPITGPDDNRPPNLIAL